MTVQTSVHLPFLDAVVSETLTPLETARLLQARAKALRVRLDPTTYVDRYEGTACLIGTLTLDLAKEINDLDEDNGELIDWLEDAVDEERFDDVQVPHTMAKVDLYEFIMDATQQVNFDTLAQLERGFESNGVNHRYANNEVYEPRIRTLYWKRSIHAMSLERLSYDARVMLYDDQSPTLFDGERQQMWASESYAFKVGYYLRLLAKGSID